MTCLMGEMPAVRFLVEQLEKYPMFNSIMGIIAALRALIPDLREKVYETSAKIVSEIKSDLTSTRDVARYYATELRNLMDGYIVTMEELDPRDWVLKECQSYAFADAVKDQLVDELGALYGITEDEFYVYCKHLRIKVFSDKKILASLVRRLIALANHAEGEKDFSRAAKLKRRAEKLVKHASEVAGIARYMQGVGFILKQGEVVESEVTTLRGHHIMWLEQTREPNIIENGDGVTVDGFKLVTRMVRGRLPWTETHVIKQELTSWQNIANRIRAIQLALNFLQIDEGIGAEVIRHNLTADVRGHRTKGQLNREYFLKDDNSTIGRLGRAQNQPGNPHSRTRKNASNEDLDVYDGWAGMQSAHDWIEGFMDEIYEASRAGLNSRMSDIKVIDSKMHLVVDIMWDQKMGSPTPPQLNWMDKTDRDNRGYFTVHHANYVFGPAELKEYALRTLNDPMLHVPTKMQATGDYHDGMYDACILSPSLTQKLRKGNSYVHSVSKKYQARIGDYRWLVMWGPKWKQPQLRLISPLSIFKSCVEQKIVETHTSQAGNSYTKRGAFVSIGVEGQLKDVVLDLMGIYYTEVFDEKKQEWKKLWHRRFRQLYPNVIPGSVGPDQDEIFADEMKFAKV